MPELPEVETVRRTLLSQCVNKTIRDVVVTLPRIIQRPDDIEQFRGQLAGQQIEGVDRRGKFLLIQLSTDVLVSHLRMEGKYSIHSSTDPVGKHTHVRFMFTDESELRYTDVRQFGTMHVFDKGTEFSELPLRQLGPEPLEAAFTPEVLASILSRSGRAVKTLLLDQTKLVGLGNIYVDEALFQAGIHPETPADEVPESKITPLHHAVKTTLQQAVDAGGSSIRSYVNSEGKKGSFQQQLYVYGRKGEACLECGHPIERTVVGGRGTHICPVCQEGGDGR
ncbi:DNA-formamidopyrimidine glycosylase [Alkalicoccus urumqiensis]|uniref:Formamidopyrimidine-DNA glycosylase n=1 Tax=Alkalicoccus urumqiensis TaxID=1548213 RepID=A0A2P6MDG8_ALKUR|nr:DNA-formamidopyrimidine glycosylase [Alkalicoccus urumqiensis]PRO64310.1 DNA-formamidopyrimidine glycosylase [Alkalicoccus urumqiensis]